MLHHNEIETFPFTIQHLNKLKEEIGQAGSFHSLMIQKKAIRQARGLNYIALYYDIEKYKRKYLVGVYQSLRPMYDTEMPYVFWLDMHEMLLKTEIWN